MKRLVIFGAAFTLWASAIVQNSAQYQYQVPPPGSEAMGRSSQDLDEMLGPIALYPDPLIAQILPAATVPSEIVLADRYVRNGNDLNQIDSQPWSASVKAVAHYPDVIKLMDDNLAWTTDLGQTFIYQPGDVMNAIQRLRIQAQSVGALQTSVQQTVVSDAGLIEIVPTNPEVIYVPSYQPDIVYGRRPHYGAGLFLSFGAGLAIGSWLNHDFDWHDHNLISWRRDEPRPRDWWYRPAIERRQTVIRNNVVVFNGRGGEHSANVWRPQSQRQFSQPSREDRGRIIRPSAPERPIINRPPPVREEPRREIVHEDRRRPEPSRQIETRAPQESRPIQAPRPTPVPQAAPPSRQPQQRAADRPSSGALIGIHSAQDTRNYSSRGQQSRGIASQPGPASRPAPVMENPASRRTPQPGPQPPNNPDQKRR